MKQFKVTIDTADIQICCKKGKFTFYNGEVISDAEIARQFPKFFIEVGVDAGAPEIQPEAILAATEEAVVEFIDGPEPELDEEPLATEAEEEAPVYEAPLDANVEPVKIKGKPGRKAKA